MLRILLTVSCCFSLLACSGKSGQDGSVENRGGNTSGWWDAQPRPQWSQYERVETPHPWFEVYRVRDNIYAIYEPGQFEEVISYLIVGLRTALLFDTGLGFGDIRGVVRSITRSPVVVVNSHSHYDHVGGNYQFDTIWGLENRYALKRSSGIAREQVAEFASPQWIWKETPPGFSPDSYAIKPWQYSRWIGDSEFIDLGDINLEVIHTPGHAPDAISLLDHKNRLLFTGDTFYLAPLYAHIEGSDINAYRASATRLAALSDKVDILLTSHNVPEASPHYLGALESALEEIIGGSTHYEISDGAREYQFDGFSILTADPP